MVDETVIKVSSDLIWLWVTIEPKNMEILALTTSKERNIFAIKRFLSSIVQDYGEQFFRLMEETHDTFKIIDSRN